MTHEPLIPLRADAARNRAAIIAAAAALFRRDGADASLEEIARAAKVGSATLHRHFTSRQALLDAVFIGVVDQLCRDGREILASVPPSQGLWTWLEWIAIHCAAQDALARLIRDGAASPEYQAKSVEVLEETGRALLDRAVAAGAARADVSVTDLLTVVNAIAGAARPGDVHRLMSLVRDGAVPRGEGDGAKTEAAPDQITDLGPGRVCQP
ncbi:helix-turn-helix transcriptional regulator [Catenulispora sp. NL8]|uniref:Helix-turn-helix transcriptional regulator n=1 Tax=Catenulispora pinistramenti TaxID=2705254 RepID=A0ABS5KGH4_9ACTN|nr:TetR/AcrR family transcriptional regulator [Catenulispora pinistramenti]MBS2545279.1 helix-turn-helix transcriptional regulator [Catenulispora pinistramenti]